MYEENGAMFFLMSKWCYGIFLNICLWDILSQFSLQKKIVNFIIEQELRD